MPLVIPAGFGSVSVNLKHGSIPRPAAVTYGVQTTSITDFQTFVNGLQTQFDTALSPILDTEVLIGPTTLRYVPSGGGEVVTILSTVLPTLGAQNVDSTPSNVALLVKKLTAQGGRRGRGRLFLPWAIPETSMGETGVLTPAYITSCTNALNTWFANFSVQKMVVLHDSTKRTVTHPSDTVTQITESEVAVPPPAEVTALQVDPVCSTQRRRLR
jgi:hypothetical protein